MIMMIIIIIIMIIIIYIYIAPNKKWWFSRGMVNMALFDPQGILELQRIGYLEIICQCSLWTAGRELWLHQIRLKIMRCSWIHWAPRFSEKCQVIGGLWHSKMLCLHVVSMVLSGVSMCCATSSSSSSHLPVFLSQKVWPDSLLGLPT